MNDLFDNQMVRNAIKAMTPEQIEHYKQIGEQMYNSINFEETKINKAIPPSMEEAVAYVVSGIKSGLHPNDLDINEISLLTDAYGKKWYEQFGYEAHELNLKKPELKAELITKKIKR